MKLYKIRNWNDLYENNRTRELKKLDWLPIPNKQDGDGYTLVMEQKDGAAIFGAWIACAQIASRCDPRGTLLRDGKKPHDSASLSRMSRVPVGVIDRMLNVVSHQDINWLEIIDIESECEIPASECEFFSSGCLEGKGKKEGNTNGVFNPTEEMLRIGKLRNRRPSTEWNDKEMRAYKKIPKPISEEVFQKLEAYYFSQWPDGADYRYRDLETLLNNWGKAVDRANNFKPHRPF